MRRLSWRNLIHDKVRFGVTLTGVVFAVILVAIQVGLLVGFSRATSDIIHHSGADLWIRSKDVPYIEVGVVF
nr:ABC transporter permease [Acidobacteriota bacterium]